ncbi:MAG TPA: NAD(P)-dependent alcohol dehydrogenase [Streptomyces sp.]|nr:NAD(P)-dependent alcohol dehydrogenase [Streptomyces sp.]
MTTTLGWAAPHQGAPLEPWTFDRRDLRDDDVSVRIDYCGICSSDLSAVARGADFPLVPGHEMTGVVTAVGPGVTDFAPGDSVAIGNIVDSCGTCAPCRAGRENWCARFPTLTYGGRDRHDETLTQGGFSRDYVVARTFLHHLPEGLDPAGAAPLMCAGVTTYVPLRRWGAGPGRAVGIVGMGGLGHIALKLSHAMGATTVQFTRSATKAAEARALGADDVVVTSDPDAMAEQSGRFDLILDTVGAPHSVEPYVEALAMDGTLVVLGIPEEDITVSPMSLIVGAKTIAGAGSGGTAETRDMLDFCARHRITADIETVRPDRINEAMDRLRRNDVRYRFVVDLSATPPRTP